MSVPLPEMGRRDVGPDDVGPDDVGPSDTGPIAMPQPCGTMLECEPSAVCVDYPSSGCSGIPDAGTGMCVSEFRCDPLPAECGGVRSCECVAGLMCPRGFGMCELDEDAQPVWRCRVF